MTRRTAPPPSSSYKPTFTFSRTCSPTPMRISPRWHSRSTEAASPYAADAPRAQRTDTHLRSQTKPHQHTNPRPPSATRPDTTPQKPSHPPGSPWLRRAKVLASAFSELQDVEQCQSTQRVENAGRGFIAQLRLVELQGNFRQIHIHRFANRIVQRVELIGLALNGAVDLALGPSPGYRISG